MSWHRAPRRPAKRCFFHWCSAHRRWERRDGDLSPLICTLALGATDAANASSHGDRLLRALGRADPPLYAGLLFIAGAELMPSSVLGLGIVGVGYTLARAAGKIVGARIGLRGQTTYRTWCGETWSLSCVVLIAGVGLKLLIRTAFLEYTATVPGSCSCSRDLRDCRASADSASAHGSRGNRSPYGEAWRGHRGRFLRASPHSPNPGGVHLLIVRHCRGQRVGPPRLSGDVCGRKTTTPSSGPASGTRRTWASR